MDSFRQRAFELVDTERERQHELGKEDNQSWAMWVIVFTDYVGRVANALWRLTLGVDESADELVSALVKALAVGVAWLENILVFLDVVGASELEGDTSEESDGEQQEDKGE